MPFWDTPAQVRQVPNFNPQQLEVLKQFLQQGSQGLQQNTFEPYAQKARQDFASKTVPLLAERFGAQGDERGSSALTSQLAGAGSNLDSTLAQMGAQHDQQLYALLSQLGLGQQFENVQDKTQPGWGSTLLEGGVNMAPELLGLLGAGLGSFLPGLGTAAGGALGSSIGAGVKGAFGSGGQQQQQQGNQQQSKPWYELLPPAAIQQSQANINPQSQPGAYNPGQYNPNVIGAMFSQLNKFNQNPMPKLA